MTIFIAFLLELSEGIVMLEKNMEKYETYKTMNENLTRALKAGFYYEAIFIEYAIFEDRLTSLLKYADVPYLDKNGRDISITQKIGKVKSCAPFAVKYVRDRIPEDLLDQAKEWSQHRNELIHHLATIPYNHESVKQLAESGSTLLKILSSRVRSVNNYHKKQHALESVSI